MFKMSDEIALKLFAADNITKLWNLSLDYRDLNEVIFLMLNYSDIIV